MKKMIVAFLFLVTVGFASAADYMNIPGTTTWVINGYDEFMNGYEMPIAPAVFSEEKRKLAINLPGASEPIIVELNRANNSFTAPLSLVRANNAGGMMGDATLGVSVVDEYMIIMIVSNNNGDRMTYCVPVMSL